MKRLVGLFSAALAAGIGVALCGCLPSEHSQADEEKEPHYLTGKAREKALDHKGAIEAFEKAVEANPASASAHFELGLLYEKNEPDYAAAIYHYERYLKLRPDAGNADLIQQRILFCKQELAKTVSLAPVTQEQQRQFEQLTAERRHLQDDVEKWKAEAEKWKALYAGRGTAPGDLPAVRGPGPRAGRPSGTPQTMPGLASPVALASANRSITSAGSPGSGTSAPARTYKIQSGDNPAAIARRYGVKLDALMAANPGLDPRRLQPGQTLNLPPP